MHASQDVSRLGTLRGSRATGINSSLRAGRKYAGTDAESRKSQLCMHAMSVLCPVQVEQDLLSLLPG